MTYPEPALPEEQPTQHLAQLLTRPRFEVLPLPDVLDGLHEASTDEAGAEVLPEGSVVTVTASPRRGLSATLDVSEKLAARRLHAVPHLAARQLTSEAELADILDRLADTGINEVFVVAGDHAQPAGPFPDGLSVLRAMADSGRRPARVGVPSYPEGHPSIADDQLWAALRAKREYADYTVTQLCFHAEAIIRFAESVRANGIDLPVIAGVPGVVDAGKLLRIGLHIGVGDSLRFLHGNRRTGGHALLRPRGYRPDSLVRQLAARAAGHKPGHTPGLAGLHFYTFNHLAATARWINAARRRAEVTAQ